MVLFLLMSIVLVPGFQPRGLEISGQNAGLKTKSILTAWAYKDLPAGYNTSRV